jgi:hypothetical protein
MTDREQPIAIRREIALKPLEGQPNGVIDRATRDLERMNFLDHQDFLGWVGECKGTATGGKEPEATEEEIDAIFGNMGLGDFKTKSSTKESEMDQI